MESASESNPKTPNSRKVEFTRTRPTLIIPPPAQWTPSSGPTPQVYARKQSLFYDGIDGIRDFTKSGLGFGEKCALWLYNQLKKLSRKWFTHMFLTVVLILYTIGGALVFEVIEGTGPDLISN